MPFGEYVPWPFYKLVRKIVPNVGRFQPGIVQKPLPVHGKKGVVNVGATVCYEGVFPEISRELVNAGAQVLVNMTNDAWYGYSSAPWQHLYMYKLRSVETGAPFVRATNTGITAWVDALGNLHQPTRLYEDAMVIADIPVKQKNTLFNLLGEWVAFPSLGIILGLFLFSFIRLGTTSGLVSLAGWICITVPFWSTALYILMHEGHRNENWVTQILMANISLLLLGVALLGETAFKIKRRRRAVIFLVAFSLMGCSVGQWWYVLLLLVGALIWLWGRKTDVE